MKRPRALYPILFLIAAGASAQNNTVVLKRAFVEQYKDRATIEATFFVDHAHKTPNRPAADGDEHVAGRAQKEVGLPMVAEIMNAALPGEAQALTEVHAVEGKNQQITIVGAWRFWFEHPATNQVQFAAVPVPANTNPDHSFEIHPITVFAGDDVSGAMVPVKGFTPHDGVKAFTAYEKLKATVSGNASAISISASKGEFNYTQFEITLSGKPKKLSDGGYAVLADVSGEGDDPVASGIRMIFLPGTSPLQQLLTNKLGSGDQLQVIGIPRVNLNAISASVQKNGGRAITGKLPYEMIIVAIAK
jgi:hypothetical protein